MIETSRLSLGLRISCLALCFFSLCLPALGDTAADLADATVVIYNRRAPDSEALAQFYAAARHLPNDHVIGLDCSTEEEISRQEYDANIAEPLRKIFAERKWWAVEVNEDRPPVLRATKIHFAALMRGMPLKIRSTAKYDGDHPENNPVGTQNNAAVDSELAALGFFSRQISGPLPNSYFQSFRPITELGEAPFLLVCRLDAPTPEIVRRMITDSIATEKTGLWGRAYVDGANHTSGGLADGDRWLKTVVQDLRNVGIPTVYDTSPALFPAGFPMTDCALYYGWYAGNVTGPFTDPGFAFLPGAIAVHIHSFSANSLRSPTANWVGPLLSKGAAASLGNVYEPYLQLTAHLDIFNDRLLHGFTFAESAYMSERVISWMNVAVGDPLYRPFASWLRLETKKENRPVNDWRFSHDFAVKNRGRKPAEYRMLERRAAAQSGNASMLEDLGLSEKEEGDFGAAVSDLRQARTIFRKRDDLLRTVLEQADALILSGDKEEALKLVREQAAMAAEAPASGLLRKIADQLSPPTPTPTPTP